MNEKNFVIPWRAAMVFRIAKFLGVTVVLAGYEAGEATLESGQIVVEVIDGQAKLTEQITMLTMEIKALNLMMAEHQKAAAWTRSFQ